MWVHRDLKPDNIMLNLDPLEVRVIDFDRAVPAFESTKGIVKGTGGYFPQASEWQNGSHKWDIWAVAAIICESDMPKDAYLKV